MQIPVHLAAQGVEVLGRGGGVDDLHVVVRAKLEIAFHAGAGVFRARPFIAVGQHQHHAVFLAPFGLRGRNELVHNNLCSVGEVPELGLPHDQSVRAVQCVAVFKAQHGGFRQRGVVNAERGSAVVQLFQRSVQGAVIEVMQDGVPLGEGAALTVLAGQAHGVVFREQAAPGQGFRHGPVQRSAFPEGLPAASQEAFFQRGVRREAVRQFRKDISDALEQLRADSRPYAGTRDGRFIRILRGGGQEVVRGIFLHLQVGLFHALPKVFPDVPLLLFRQFPAFP